MTSKWDRFLDILLELFKSRDMSDPPASDELLHHETFQKAEATWRGVEDLVNHTNFQANINIDLLDVSKQELAQDFEKKHEFTASRPDLL